jgi:hypothetical protein
VLALNSDNSYTTAVLLQFVRGQTRILADWVAEGSPSETLSDLAGYARATLPSPQTPFKTVAPLSHFNHYDTIGLRAAALKIPLTVYRGSPVENGLAELRRLLSTAAHGRPAISLAQNASWSLRALGGGYARSLTPRAAPHPVPQTSLYEVLVHGLCATLAATAVQEQVDTSAYTAYTKSGVPYLSSRR